MGNSTLYFYPHWSFSFGGPSLWCWFSSETRLLQRKGCWTGPCVSRVFVCSGDVVIVVVVFPQSVAAVLVCSLPISFPRHIEFYYRKLYYYYVLHSVFSCFVWVFCCSYFRHFYCYYTQALFLLCKFLWLLQVMIFVHKVSSYFGSHTKICEILFKLLRRTRKQDCVLHFGWCFNKHVFFRNSPALFFVVVQAI